MAFSSCLAIVLESEGGFVDDSQDPGGATNLGVTLRTLSGWLGRTATIAEVEALTPDAVASIYLADYWNPSGCPVWPPGVDLMVFDAAVNEGVGHAIRTLQEAVGAAPDGLIGPDTRKLESAQDAVTTINEMAKLRVTFYQSLPDFSHFGAGWLARVERTRVAAIRLVT